MAGKKENLKALFTNTRSRVIIIFTLAILILAIVIGFFRFMSYGSDASLTADVATAPNIQSIPGALNPTAQYAKLQENQNENQAASAMKTGGSTIPTIIRSQAIGSGVDVVGAKAGQSGGVGFSGLNRENEEGSARKNWIDNLKKSNCDSATVKEVMKAGASIEDIKQACTCSQLKDRGYAVKDLQTVCSCSELKAAGVNIKQFKEAGFTVKRLRDCGFSACEVKAAGFSAQEMLEGGFTPGELKGSGFTDDQISRASGVPEGVTADDIRKAGCKAAALAKLRSAGVTASAIRRISGCTADQLKAAGYTEAELRQAGFPASVLKNLFSPESLKSAGFSARDLLDAGLSARTLAGAGFSAADIQAGEDGLPPGMTPDDIKNAGCGPEAIRNLHAAGVSDRLIKKYSDCPAKAETSGVTDADIKAAGCEKQKLTALLQKGVTAKKIRELNGCSLKQLKDAGFDAKALSEAGFSPEELLAAGFTADDLRRAGLAPAAFIAKGRTANCSVASLTAARKAGVSATTIRQTLGCSAAQMRAAGFTAKELKDAGFTAAELKDAGFSAKELKEAGFSAKELRDAGFTPEELKAAGFSAQEAGIVSSEVAVLKPAEAEQKAPSTVPVVPVVQKVSAPVTVQQANADRVKEILNRQKQQLADQKYQQQIQQRTSAMMGTVNQAISEWKKVSTQAYVQGNNNDDRKGSGATGGVAVNQTSGVRSETTIVEPAARPKIIIKTGDVLFAVIDTSVNSDEPSPILATIVSGKLKGSKLIGSFNLPPNAEKMVISFTTLSIPGAPRSVPINAYAIDPNTARTALSSRTNHHFLIRYGSLFASSFLEGIGNAFQSADTTVTVSGAGGNGSVTVQNGINRSVLQNAIIALNAVGKAWGQAAQQVFQTPTTVEVYSGSGIGVLFTQDLTTL